MNEQTVIQALEKTTKDIKDAVLTLHEVGNEAEDCIYLLQTSFINNSIKHTNACRVKLENIINAEHKLTKEVDRIAWDNPILKPYMAVPVHFLKIGKNIEKLADLIDKKIREGILFSDKAIVEITFLLQRLIDLLETTKNILLARNRIMSSYVQESAVDVVRRAMEYATLHEERLIEGLCLSEASPIYLRMLDSIKDIALRAKEIATELL